MEGPAAQPEKLAAGPTNLTGWAQPPGPLEGLRESKIGPPQTRVVLKVEMRDGRWEKQRPGPLVASRAPERSVATRIASGGGRR